MAVAVVDRPTPPPLLQTHLWTTRSTVYSSIMTAEIEARHKKELKAFDTEKRTALKKIKGTAGKGKKGKELIAA